MKLLFHQHLGALTVGGFSSGLAGNLTLAPLAPHIASSLTLQLGCGFVHHAASPAALLTLPTFQLQHARSLKLFGNRPSLDPFLNDEKARRITEERVSRRAEGYQLLDRALAIENAGLKLHIAELMAQAGMVDRAREVFEDALAVDIGDAEENATFKLDIGRAMAQAGMVDRAREVFEGALAIDIGDAEQNAACKRDIAAAMAEVGMLDRAREVFESEIPIMYMRDDYENASLKLEIARMMAQAGMVDRAGEVFEAALAIDIGDAEENATFKLDIGRAMAQAGMVDRAREVFEAVLAINTGSARRNARLKRDIAEMMVQARMGDRAREVFEGALAIDTGDAEQNAELKRDIGAAMAKAEMVERAREVFEAALEIDTGNVRRNTKLKRQIGQMMARAGMLDRAREVFEGALAIDTGDAEQNAELKRDIGAAMAQVGKFEEALAIDTGDAEQNAELKCDIGAAMVEAGMVDHARDVFEAALEIDTGNVRRNAELKRQIGQMMARAGMLDRAREVFEAALTIDNVWDAWERAVLTCNLGTAMAQVGMLDHAREVLEATLAIEMRTSRARAQLSRKINSRDARARSQLLREISDAMAQTGMFEAALAIDTRDPQYNSSLKYGIGSSMAQTGAKLLQESASGMQDLLALAPFASRQMLVRLGRSLTIEEIHLVAASMGDHSRREETTDLMLTGFLSVWRLKNPLPGSDRAVLIKRHARIVQEAIRDGEGLAVHAVSLKILYHLQEMGEAAAAAVVIDAGRQLISEGKPDYTLSRILAQCDSFKAKELALTAATSGKLTERQSWLLIQSLIDTGYLDQGLRAYLDERIAGSSEVKQTQADERSFLLQSIQYIHQGLSLCPDRRLLEFVLEGAEDVAQLRARVEDIKGQKAQLEAIADRRELIAELAKDERLEASYFILYGGKTRYALIDNYDLKKFLIVVRKMHKQQIHEGPLEEFLGLFPEGRRESLKGDLIAGRFPLSGASGHTIRIDVSSSAQIDALNRRAAEVFGSRELGNVIKLVMYAERSDLTQEEREALKNVQGIGDAHEAIDLIEKHHPDVAQEVSKKLRKRWKKLMGKRVLEVGIDQVLGNETNEVALGRMVEGLERARGALGKSVRQEYKAARKAEDVSTEAARLLRDQRLAALEEKARAKLLRYILQNMLIGEGDERANQLFDEWESHLDQVLTDFEGLRESDGLARREKMVRVRFLDKREDLIECVRVADSAQCCFNSKNYIIQNGRGAADWIAMLWADPLSFAFQIEESPATNPAKAIGFVFGSFGVRGGKPVVLLNGVYMEGKSDTAAQAILRQIEQQFSRPLGMKMQLVASQHAGTAKMDESYSNEPIEVRRLRALADGYRHPMNVIYDDLDVGVNEPKTTQNHVWHKELD